MRLALLRSVAMPMTLMSFELRQRGAGASFPPRLRKRRSAGRLLDRFAERKQRLLVEWTADELQPERQAFARKARGRDQSRQASHVDGHGEDVVEIHLDRVLRSFLADPERRGRSRGRQNTVAAAGESALEVPLDEGSNFLRPRVIGVIVTGGEDIGADHQT